MLAYPVQVIEIAAYVVPQPPAAAVQNDAILLTIVVIRLVFSPSWPLNQVT